MRILFPNLCFPARFSPSIPSRSAIQGHWSMLSIAFFVAFSSTNRASRLAQKPHQPSRATATPCATGRLSEWWQPDSGVARVPSATLFADKIGRALVRPLDEQVSPVVEPAAAVSPVAVSWVSALVPVSGRGVPRAQGQLVEVCIRRSPSTKRTNM
jgi:hypothetical protein